MNYKEHGDEDMSGYVLLIIPDNGGRAFAAGV